MDQEPRLDPAMVEMVSVLIVQPFHLGNDKVATGDVVQVSRARADYLVFLKLAAWL